MKLFKKLTLACLCSAALGTHAGDIILNDTAIRDDLNWLNTQGVINVSTSTWPLSHAEITRALDAVTASNAAQTVVINSIRRSLQQQQLPLQAHLNLQSAQTVPQQFGQAAKAEQQIGMNLHESGENWAIRLNVNAERKPLIDNNQNFNLEGSYLAAKFGNQWLVAGQIPTWWGAGHDNSLIRGDASRPVVGMTLQRDQQMPFQNKWLNWLGKWQYQAFAGQLQDYQAIPNTKLLGLRLTAQPLPYLELGASRMLEWGGQGRPQSVKSLLNAFVGNKDNGGTGAPDPSNQLAGFDFTLNLASWLQQPISVYGQYIGEDEAGLLPAKNMFQGGVSFASDYRHMPYQLYAEWNNTTTNGNVERISYNHSIYTDGYYQHGYPLGAAIGGDSEMVSVGGTMQFDRMNRVEGRIASAQVNQSNLAINRAFPQNDQLNFAELAWTHQLTPYMPLKVKGWISQSDLHGNDTGGAVSIDVPLDGNLSKLFR